MKQNDIIPPGYFQNGASYCRRILFGRNEAPFSDFSRCFIYSR